MKTKLIQLGDGTAIDPDSVVSIKALPSGGEDNKVKPRVVVNTQTEDMFIDYYSTYDAACQARDLLVKIINDARS